LFEFPHQVLALSLNFVYVHLLVLSRNVHQGEISRSRLYSVFEVDQIKKQVAERRELWVELALADHSVGFHVVVLCCGEVLSNFHEADAVTVGKVVQKFKLLDLLLVRFVVVAELLYSLLGHIFAVDCG